LMVGQARVTASHVFSHPRALTSSTSATGYSKTKVKARAASHVTPLHESSGSISFSAASYQLLTTISSFTPDSSSQGHSIFHVQLVAGDTQL
jgi:hypothetical protein